MHGVLRHSDFQQCSIGKKSGWGSPSGHSTSKGRGGKLTKFPGTPARSTCTKTVDLESLATADGRELCCCAGRALQGKEAERLADLGRRVAEEQQLFLKAMWTVPADAAATYNYMDPRANAQLKVTTSLAHSLMSFRLDDSTAAGEWQWRVIRGVLNPSAHMEAS